MTIPLLLAVVFSLSSPVLTIPVVMAQPYTTDAQLTWIREMETCEDPTGNPNIKILDSNNRYSYSVLQFQMATWLKYSDMFGTNKDNIYDPVLQERVATYMLNNHGERNWMTCAARTKDKLGAYPASEDS